MSVGTRTLSMHYCVLYDELCDVKSGPGQLEARDCNLPGLPFWEGPDRGHVAVGDNSGLLCCWSRELPVAVDAGTR